MADLREWLEDVHARTGAVDPEVLVREAEPTASLHHDRFEWDDGVAGHAHRLEQARSMIRQVRVVYAPATKRRGPRSVRAWHSVPSVDGGHRVYMPTSEIAADPVLAAIVLRDMERDWKQLRQRYGHMVEFIDMVREALEDTAA